MNTMHFLGWNLIGQYPEGDFDGVGSFLLCHEGEAALLEVPPGLTVERVRAEINRLHCTLRFVTASHDHEDHLDSSVWRQLNKYFTMAQFIHPATVHGDWILRLCGEPVYLVKAPKHSLSDVVTIFRGVAMTGDIELETLDSVSDEVGFLYRANSFERLAEFEERRGYKVHSIVSAHLNDVRRDVNWKSLFLAEGIPVG